MADYLVTVRKLALLAQLSEELTIQTALHGLHPTVKPFMGANPPTTMDELLTKASDIEEVQSTERQVPNAALHEAVASLTKRIDNLTNNKQCLPRPFQPGCPTGNFLSRTPDRPLRIHTGDMNTQALDIGNGHPAPRTGVDNLLGDKMSTHAETSNQPGRKTDCIGEIKLTPFFMGLCATGF